MTTMPAGKNPLPSRPLPGISGQGPGLAAGSNSLDAEYGRFRIRCSRAERDLLRLRMRDKARPDLPHWVRRADKLADEIGSLYLDLRLLASTVQYPPDDTRQHASMIPLGLLLEQEKAIERHMKQARRRGGRASYTVRWPLVALRAKADRLERWQKLMVAADPQAFETAVRWAADLGDTEELLFLRHVIPPRTDVLGEPYDLVTWAVARIEERLNERNDLLAAALRHRQAPEEALLAIGKIGERGAGLRQQARAPLGLQSDALSFARALFEVLARAEHMALRAEAAWALGQLSGRVVAPSLLLYIAEAWSDPSLLGELRSALVASLTQTLDAYSLAQLAAADPVPLRRVYQMLQKDARHLDALDAGYRVDLVNTLVALELRAERVRARLSDESSLAEFLRPGTDLPIQDFSAVAALNELTTVGERQGLWQWVQGEREIEERLKPWPARLEKAARRPLSTGELRRFLMAAGRFDAIRADVETSFRLLRSEQPPGQIPQSSLKVS